MPPYKYIIMKKNKQKIRKENHKDIGGTKLNFKNRSFDLDPNKDLCLIEHKTKGQEAYYKGQKIKYLDYYAELADREERAIKGKDTGNLSVGTFAGVSFDKSGKIIKS